jgi:hypothetical protein
MATYNKVYLDLGIPELDDRAFKREGKYIKTYMGGGGGSAPQQPTNQTVTQTNLPEYARPYFEDILKRGQAQSNVQYVPYEGERLAGMTPQEQAVQSEALGMGTPGQFDAATKLTTQAGLGSIAAGQYDPSQFTAQQIGAPNLQQFQMGPALGVNAQQVNAPQMQGAQTGFDPRLQAFQMQAPQNVSSQQVGTRDISGATTSFDPNLQRFQMQGPQDIFAQQVSAQNIQGAQMAAPQQFGQAQADQYMSPYMQSVVDVQKRRAFEDAQKAQLSQNLAAARQGTYGGARQTLAMTEREKALQQQLGDIQATGLQSAFGQAQQQFERDRAAGMQAGMANLTNEQQARVQSEANRLQAQGMNQQQALQAAMSNQQAQMTTSQQNLQAALGVQELGTTAGLQTSLANLSNEQQARVQSEANRLQASGMNQEQALRAALSNQQAGLTVGQQNLASQMQTQELGTQTGMQTALANLSNQQQAAVQNQAAQLQAQGMNQEQALRAALANQQAGLTVGQQNLASLLETQRLGATSGLQAAQANQQAALEAQRLAEQSRQFGGTLGLQGLQQAGQAGATLGQLGTAQQQSDLARLQAQAAAAGQTRSMDQQLLDMQYADFLRQRDFPMEQLGQFSSLLRGMPMQMGSTQTAYAPPPSMLSQVGGTGLAGLGLYNMYK